MSCNIPRHYLSILYTLFDRTRNSDFGRERGRRDGYGLDGLDWNWNWIGIELDWIEFDRIGLDCIGLELELDSIGLQLDWNWIGIGLDWIGLDWTGLD